MSRRSALVNIVTRHFRQRSAALWLTLVFLACFAGTIAAVSNPANLTGFLDNSGVLQTFTTNGFFDANSAFMRDLGMNGRSCATCHQPSDAWTVTPAHIQARFAATQGLDPIFRTNDGANCPTADVSTLNARQAAYSMLLTKGLIRVSLSVPTTADFQVLAVNDPHACAETTTTQLALFRRPLPAANLSFLTTVMWDGRESHPGNTLEQNLTQQAIDATTGHAQGVQPSDQQVRDIVRFELANYTAQGQDNSAQNLGAQGATGGPVPLAHQNFFVGINDPLGPAGGFNAVAMTMFDGWAELHNNANVPTNSARVSIARGQALFNTLPITISGVAGLNDAAGVPASFTGTCTTCHNTPNVGNHSVALPINIGVTDYPALPALDTTGLPVYTIQCDAGGAPIHTTDPGRALVTGNCADVGKTKGPILRGLAARAPYFHNGSAATLMDVVNFYEQRFNLSLTAQQKQDLVAFLGAL
jgi:cytochrome c peroxidase